jgi:hypothetical protein
MDNPLEVEKETALFKHKQEQAHAKNAVRLKLPGS